MTRSLEDPTFAGRVESVDNDLSYHVEFDGREQPRPTASRVFENPELMRTDAQLDYPAYTAIEPKTVEDIRHVTAVEGTELTLLCRLNKEVASAKLVDEKGQAIALARRPREGSPSTARRSRSPIRTATRSSSSTARAGRTSCRPRSCVNVTRNRPPAIAMSQPGARRPRLAGGGAHAQGRRSSDDFGVVRHGVSFTIGRHGAARDRPERRRPGRGPSGCRPST